MIVIKTLKWISYSFTALILALIALSVVANTLLVTTITTR